MTVGDTIFAVTLAVALDWGARERLSQMLHNFDYHHWPVTKLLIVGVALIVMGIVLFRLTDDARMPQWLWIPAIAAMIGWVIIGLHELRRQ